jgi:tetratricopeptide (TPR) repeat protein
MMCSLYTPTNVHQLHTNFLGRITMRYSRTLLFILLLVGFGLPVMQKVTASGGDKKIPITTSSQEARELFLKGRDLVDNLRLTDGNPFFKKATELDPEFALAHLFAAQTSASGKEFFASLEQATTNAGKASDGERLWIMSAQAGAYAKSQDQKKCLMQLAELFPQDERAQMLLGIYYFGQQDYGKAAEYLKRSTDIAPGFAPAYNQLGYAYRFLERFDDAEATFKKYTQLIPDDPNPHDSYAELLLKIGRYDDAVTAYDKALAVDNHFGNSYAGISSALTYEGKHGQALLTLEKALTLARTDAETRAALFSRTVVYVDRGDFDEGLKEMHKQYAIARKTGDAAGMAGDLVAMGNIYIEKGDAEAAIKQFSQATEAINSSNLANEVKENAALIYYYNEGRAKVAKHDLPAATKDADKLLKGAEQNKNPNQIRLAHELKGMIALESKDYQSTINELRQSSMLNPYNLYRLAKAYTFTGDKQKAKETMRKAAKFNSLPALNYAFIRMKAEKELNKM